MAIGMPLTLQPNDASPGDYRVTHGELEVGQIYKRKAPLRPESQWLWALNGLPAGSPISGSAATLDEAMAGLEARWQQWLAWANLSEKS
jgi:hypothetical protein